MMPSTLVTAVVFGDEQIQIQFLEAEKQSPIGSIEESLTVVLDSKSEALVIDIREALVEIIDAYKVSLRNPPVSIGTGNRFLAEASDNED